ncbi:hypothetical protein LB559_14670 [Mesorhizobium sp. BR1-1-3]|uniref:hypothetical protein n=1 Tax=Mesorhizobium sp. BR1-1-3 TaxID=2876651 RepID=UPI001CD1897E|nr:hypothetical protein [Mesorhizobium sp. BR1-1-3]MBZ9889183.1 hypothetical protein [Mesorhizobium sp. BR1-1-3]
MKIGLDRIDRPFRWMLAVAAVGLLLCILGLLLGAQATICGWVTMALFLLGLSLGAMTIMMIHGLTGGRWGDAALPPLRAMVATLPLALVLLLPVLVRPDFVFPWAADPAALTETARHKLAYLNVPFFLVRFAVCVIVWFVLAWFLLGPTATVPVKTAQQRRARSMGCAAGLVVHGFAVSVFSTDWMLSLEPNFYSTIYGMLEASAETIGAYAVAVLVLAARRSIETMPGGAERVALSEDVANMLFGLMLTWAYLAFMQWLIIWGGDLPVEIHWYIMRTRNGWQFVLWLIALQFVLPFAGFLSRDLKRSHAGIVWLAAITLAGHLADVLWRVRPAFAGFGLSWPDLAALAGAGGLWTALFVFALREPERIAAWRERLARGRFANG